jgi:hypothetical protein
MTADAGRFSLTVKLLGGAARPSLQRLFEGLAGAAAAADAAAGEASAAAQGAGEGAEQTAALLNIERVAALRKAYGV